MFVGLSELLMGILVGILVGIFDGVIKTLRISCANFLGYEKFRRGYQLEHLWGY